MNSQAMAPTIDVNLFYIAFVLYTVSMFLYFFSFRKEGRIAKFGSIVLGLGLFVQTAGLVIRAFRAEFMPVTNMYEYLNFFSATIVLFYLILEHRTKKRTFGAFIMPVVFLLMAFSSSPTTEKTIAPLIPALQSQWLVWHVIFSIIGEAAFAVAFGASVMYLVRSSAKKGGWAEKNLPELNTLDIVSYRAIAIGFPVFTIGALIFGAIWAKYAWGDYWTWDPKETWALITWIVYAIYLHARILRGWKGKIAAWISILGFLVTLFTLFGVNYLISGLHSYA